MRNVPKLRFKEFSGEWEEKRLEEITTYVDYRGKTPEKTENGIFLVTAKNIKMGYIDYTTSQEFVSSENYDEIMKRGKPKIGDVLLTTEAPLGNVAQIDKEDIALAQRVIKFRGQKNLINNTFLKYIFLSENFQNKLKNKAIGTTVLGIQGKVLHKLTLNFSSFLIEQQKIADFLSSVDKKISITEEKLDLFKDYKKGIMQKIFKQELRFKDSNGNDYPEWEEKILGKIIIKNKEKNKENKYNLVQSISNKFGFVNQDEYFEDRRVASQDLKNYYVAKNKLFAYNPSRINVGSLAYKEDNNISVISPLYVSFYSNKEYLIDNFLFNWLFSSPFIKQMSCSFEGSVRNNLSFETLSNFIIELPCLEEQEKIANFLSSIDKKIDNLAAELEDLKEFKKGLLQQMFV